MLGDIISCYGEPILVAALRYLLCGRSSELVLGRLDCFQLLLAALVATRCYWLLLTATGCYWLL